MLDIKEIMNIIPQRAPFLMVDRIEEYVPGKSAVGYKNICINEWYFQGHFPNEPIMPGVLIVEALAQTGAVALLSLPEFKGKTAYFGGIKSAKFRKVVRPGDSLRLEVTLEKIRNNVGLGKAVATVDGKKACTAELTFMIG